MTHLEQARMAAECGADFIQLRSKRLPPSALVEIGIQIMELCKKYPTNVIVNDYPEVAAKIDCFGVHLGSSDLSPSEAKEVLTPFQKIGFTVNSPEGLSKLDWTNIDYVGLGPLNKTTTKKNHATPLGVDGLRSAAKEILKNKPLDIFAIGGIGLEDLDALSPLISSGEIAGVAVSSFVLSNLNPVAAFRSLSEKIKERSVVNC